MNRPAPTLDRPILLVGLPGAGKSTIAPLLAARLGLPSHDSDALIEARRGRSVTEIIRDNGEARFRAEERGIVAALLGGAASVTAAGGGAWLDAGVRAIASEHAIAIWLDAGLETLIGRLGEALDRPLLTGDVPARLAALKAARDPIYALAAVRVDANRAPATVVELILAALAEPVR